MAMTFYILFGGAMQKVAIFDVDYTLTKRETLAEFYMFMLKKNPGLIRYIPCMIFTAILYLVRIFDAGRAKEMFISFVNDIDENRLKVEVRDFYENRLKNIFYKDAIDTLKKLKSDGYRIYLISASAEFYLDELYDIKEVDKIIGTKFTFREGKFRNKITGENCKGEAKVKRFLEEIKKEKIDVDYKNSYMFSDSLSDLPLFKLVGNPCLINSKKKYNNIKNLKWK